MQEPERWHRRHHERLLGEGSESARARLRPELREDHSDDGRLADRVYNDFSERRAVTSNGIMFEIKTDKDEVADLKVTIERAEAHIQVQVEELADAIAIDEAGLKAAIEIRTKVD